MLQRSPKEKQESCLTADGKAQKGKTGKFLPE